MEFREPQTVPQDLLLIQDIVGTIQLRPPLVDPHSDDDSIASSDNEADSEVEVAAKLEPCGVETPIANGTPDDSDSESSSEEESEGDAVRNSVPAPTSHVYASDHAECEELGTAGDIGYVHTKNELVESDIVVPDISQVDPTDVLEKLGEVMSIVGNVVIVKGLPADNVKTLAERALDIETLLVFEDRQVLGHIYETFGPTSQPLYQIKFNQKYPLDIEKVRIYREVFHVPQKSKYIFVDQLKRLRGSDASNMHDEEPAEDELEFSDDEQEAAFKQQRKRKRQHSVASSRQSTPAPSQEYTADNIFYGSNPYDAHGPYDDDYRVSGPSRPPPLPYDDPYAEPAREIIKQEPDDSISGRSQSSQPNDRHFEARGRGRGHRGRGHGHEGRGRGRGRMQRGRPGQSRSAESREANYFPPSLASNTPEDAATGHFAGTASMYSSAPWSYQQPGDLHSPSYQTPVQPHINPRFASAFGFALPGNMGQWNSQQGQATAPYYMAQAQQNWGAVWPRPGDDAPDGDTYSPM